MIKNFLAATLVIITFSGELYAQYSVAFRPGFTYADYGDQYGGTLNLQFQREFVSEKLYVGFALDTYYSTARDYVAYGETNVITSSGESPWYLPFMEEWEHGFWQSEASLNKQLVFGVGPSLRYIPFSFGRHNIAFTSDVLLTYNEQQYTKESVTITTDTGFRFQLSVPQVWRYWDIALGLGFDYEYRLTSTVGIGFYGYYRENLTRQQLLIGGASVIVRLGH